LRLRLDAVPRTQPALLRGRRIAGGAAADDADPGPARVHDARAERHVPGDLAGAHRLRAAVRDLPAAQLLLGAAAGHVRVRLHRRGVAHDRLLPAGAADLGAGVGVAGDLPVSLGVERFAGRADLPGRSAGRGADDGDDLEPGQLARPG